MNIVGRVTVNMKPVQQVMKRLGVDARGDVQRYFTNEVNSRIGKYMPFRTGVLSTKLKFIESPSSIKVAGPYARFLYYGKLMVDPKTGAAGFMTKDGWRSRKGVPKVESDRPITYSTHMNALAGPFWDKHLVANEGRVMQQDLQNYINRKGRK